MAELTIGEVARRAGIRPSALRYYESVGLLPAPRRVGGQRRYGAAVLDQLAVIRLAQQAGFTVVEIRTLLHGFTADTPPPARWRALAERKLVEVDRLLRRVQLMKRLLEASLDCACPTLDDCARLLARETDATGQATSRSGNTEQDEGAGTG